MFESTVRIGTKSVKYIPALGFNSLTTFFDSFQRWAAKESAFKPIIVVQAKIQENSKVLDLGCGTGALSILVKKTQPSAEVIGIDIDPRILNIAREKAAQACMQINYDMGTATKLPYPDKSFDRVVSSLVFHHLTTPNKILALKEAWRVLKPNGGIYIADFGKPQNIMMRLPAGLMRRMEETEDNVRGLLPHMLEMAGFHQVQETTKFMTIFGTISLYSGLKISDKSI